MSSVSEQVLVLNQLEQPKSTQGLYELPCGYLDENGILHREIELSELTGNEEDLLASRSVPNHKKMSVVIGRCLRRIGNIVDRGKLAVIGTDLTVGDRTFILFALRRITLGDDYPFKSTCKSCGKESMYRVDMATLEIQQMKEPTKRIYDGKLPSGKSIRFRVLTGLDEERIAKYTNQDDKLSMSLLVRLEMLDGKPPTMQDIKALSMNDRDQMRVLFDGTDGGVDTTLEMTCPQCGAEFEDEVDPGQEGFFFPSMTLKKSKIRSSTS